MHGRARRRVRGAVSTALVALVVLLAAALVGVRLAGLRPYVILSGSMEPAYPVGSRRRRRFAPRATPTTRRTRRPWPLQA